MVEGGSGTGERPAVGQMGRMRTEAGDGRGIGAMGRHGEGGVAGFAVVESGGAGRGSVWARESAVRRAGKGEEDGDGGN